jgi:hypothetical protein
VIHPADWARLSDRERFVAVIRGDLESGLDWRAVRVAELCGVDPQGLAWEVEAERGWESHDPGYVRRLIESAADPSSWVAGPH